VDQIFLPQRIDRHRFLPLKASESGAFDFALFTTLSRERARQWRRRSLHCAENSVTVAATMLIAHQAYVIKKP
jgi:hypothetical protein